MNSSYSFFAEILFVVTQESILGPLLFNAYTCDLLYDIDDLDFARFANDNFPYSCISDTISALRQFKGGIDKLFDWNTKNFLKGNADKCNLIASSNTSMEIEVSNITVISKEKVKFFEIYIDNRLNFISLVKKAEKILHAPIQVFHIFHEHFTTQINCKFFCNVSILTLSFNLDVSQPSYGTQDKQNS